MAGRSLGVAVTMFIDTPNLSCFVWLPGRALTCGVCCVCCVCASSIQWGVGQLADRPAVNREVGGSSPPAPVIDSPDCARTRVSAHGTRACYSGLTLILRKR